MNNSRKNSRLHTALSLAAAVLVLAWLPARAQAQFSFILTPATLSALPGTNALTFSGTLTNSGATALTYGGHPDFNLITGPAGADLSAFPILWDGNFYGPNSLAPGQTVTSIFSVDIDPTAVLGKYTGNFSVDYGGHTAGQGITVNVGPPQVPEAGTLPLLTLGIGYIGRTLLAARRRAMPQRR